MQISLPLALLQKEQPAVPKMQQKLRNPMDQYKMWILLQEVSFISISMI